MDPRAATAVAVLCAVLTALLATTLVVQWRAQRRWRTELETQRSELAAMTRRLERLDEGPPAAEPTARSAARASAECEFVITTAPSSPGVLPAPGAGSADPPGTLVGPAGPTAPLSAGAFASQAAGESLVTVLSLGHGVRRALSAENRNRIGFEMRREVRRARRERRREAKEAKRHLRSSPRPDRDAA